MRNRWAQARNGLYIAGALLLAIGWILLVAFGAGMAFSDMPHHRVLGWMFLAIAGLLAALSVDRWVKILPGVLGLMIINASIAVWKGYAGPDPSLKLPRRVGLVILLILVVCSALALTLQSRQLTTMDRVALCGFLVCLGLAIALFPSLIGFGLMLCCLATAWVADRVRQQWLK